MGYLLVRCHAARKVAWCERGVPTREIAIRFSRPWPWGYYTNAPNAAASIAPTSIGGTVICFIQPVRTHGPGVQRAPVRRRSWRSSGVTELARVSVGGVCPVFGRMLAVSPRCTLQGLSCRAVRHETSSSSSNLCSSNCTFVQLEFAAVRAAPRTPLQACQTSWLDF